MSNLSKDLYQRALRVIPGGVHSPVRSFKGLDREPIFFKEAQGPELTSIEGKKYLDYCMSFGPLILGHRDEEVQAAVEEMIRTAWTFGACEPYSLELAEWITQELPWVEKLRFVSSGTEAVMSALRLARGFTGRSKILKFDGCYHGHADALLVQSGSGLAGEAVSSSAGIPQGDHINTLVAPLNSEQSVIDIFEQHGPDIAAVIIEPLPANYGLLPQRQAFLNFIRDITQKNKTLLIFDEVISGFRLALGGMVERTGIIPDLVCYGKVIGGGFPVGCYGGREEILNLVAPLGPVYQAGTLSANPVGMKAGLVTLQKMKRMNGWRIIEEKTNQLKRDLNELFLELNKKIEIVSYGSLFWLKAQTENEVREITQIPPQQKDEFKNLFLKLLDEGIYLAPHAYEVGFMSLAHSEKCLDRTKEAFRKVLI